MITVIVVVGYVLVICCIVFGIYQLLQSITLINAAKQNMQRIYTQLREKDEKRIAELEKERRQFGTTSGRPDSKESLLSRFLQRIDDVIIYSEAGIHYRWLNTMTYVVLSILLFAVVTLIGMLFTGNILIGLIIGIVVVLVPYVIMVHFSDKNYKATENNLSFFINMVANSSLVTNDIVTVLKEASQFSVNPIRSAINRALASSELAESSADKRAVFVSQLVREIEHPLFVRFIRNLELSSRNDADFHSVAKDYGRQLETNLASLERQRAIFANGRNEILLLAVMGLFIMPQATETVDMTFLQAISAMFDSALGILVFVIEIAIYGGTALYLLVGQRR